MRARDRAQPRREGLRAIRTHWNVIFWAYLGTVLVGAPLALALATLVHGYFGSSLSGAVFAERLEPVLWIEFVRSEGAGLRALLPLAAGLLVISALASVFTNGVVLGAIRHSRSLSAGKLFAEGGRVFPRLLRLSCFGVIFTALTLFLPAALLWKGQGALSSEWLDPRYTLALRLTVVSVLAVLAAWSVGAYDLMKLEAVCGDQIHARVAFGRGLLRALRRPLGVVSVAGPFIVLSVLVTLALSLIDVRIGRSSMLMLAVGLGVQQLAALLRAGLKVAMATAELEWASLHNAVTPRRSWPPPPR